MCNPKISTILKAKQQGFLKGCPYIREKLILNYLNPSPATAKGHMKRPRHGIRSTTPKARNTPTPIVPVITFPAVPESVHSKETSEHNKTMPNIGANKPHLIMSKDKEESIANVFVFGAFADKNNGIVYHDLTGLFPFMSLDGSVCFFILYHYESNCILTLPIARLNNISIFNTYKKQFEELAAKGFKPKLNVMDNQTTKHIKIFLTINKIKLQLIEPHNHHVNAAERAIQTLKDAFIVVMELLTAISHSNCGTESLCKFKTPST